MAEQKGDSGQVLTSFQRRVALTGRITLFCTLFGLLHFTLDLSQGNWQSALADLVISIAVFACYLLNRHGYHRTAKVGGLFLMNLSMAVYACLVPPNVGVYLFFFPLMTIGASLFGEEELVSRYILIVLPFVLLVTLFVTDFQMFGGIALEVPENPKMFFLINVISSGLISILCINFMLKLNETSEHELKRLASEVNAKNEDLVRTNAELDRFLYSTSHDLRSPLSSVKGLINVARYDTTDPKIHEYFNMMTDRVNRLEMFIKDIIDYSRNTRTEIAAEEKDIGQLVDDVVDQLKYVEGAKDIRMMVEVDVPVKLVIDHSRLHVVLSNLVANAIKYHDRSKDDLWIKITGSFSNGVLALHVMDNGSGIAPEHHQRIFEMFYRGTHASNGSGLGLYIVRQTLEKMGGTIRLQSTVGQGSDFMVQVPATAS